MEQGSIAYLDSEMLPFGTFRLPLAKPSDLYKPRCDLMNANTIAVQTPRSPYLLYPYYVMTYGCFAGLCLQTSAFPNSQ